MQAMIVFCLPARPIAGSVLMRIGLAVWLVLLPFSLASGDNASPPTANIPPEISPEPPITSPATPLAENRTEPARLSPTTVPLDFVTDRSDLSTSADVEAYYGLLDYVRRVDPAELQAAAAEVLEERWKSSEFADWPLEEFQFYYDLTQRPQEYRGQPVTLYGHIRMHHVDHPQNPYGLDPIHIAYLYTSDSQHHPVRVVFTENPDKVPVGEQVISGIQVTGYFLKLYRYRDRDGQSRFMPLVVARSIRWIPPAPPGLSLQATLALLGTMVAILLSIVWWARRTRRIDDAARERERNLLNQDRPTDFTALS